MRAKRTVGDIIARAIRRRDTSYFFENYSTQADQVLKELDEEGYAIMRKTPSQRMIEAGVESMTLGIHNKSELVVEIYTRMIEAGRKRPF